MGAADRIAQTTASQARASDPRASAWVSANAGTGKTRVLVERVLRLLLHVDPATGHTVRPETILCLTYTKAAAGEMENRLFDTLAGWATEDEAALAETLAKLTGASPDADTLARARRLFATTLDTKGGLKIYTIHAFCERLLHRFPLEAGIASGFRVLDEPQTRALLDEAIGEALARAAAPDDPLYAALMQAIAFAPETRFRDIVDAVLARRDQLRAIIDLHGPAGPAAAEHAALAALFGVPEGADEAALARDMGAVIDAAGLRAALAPLEESEKKTDRDTAGALRCAMEAATPEHRAEALEKRFLTKDGGLRSQLATKDVKAAHPEPMERLAQAQADFFELARMRSGLRIADASAALLALAGAIFDAYEARKRRRAALDYDDLIEKTGALLENAPAAAWVLYKLDYGIDHILIDEAQDTSPAQWRVIDALAGEFFAGRGVREASTMGRTVFAVGDEKQSIYSFQGADPAEFARQGRQFARAAEAAESALNRVPLTVSFRSTEAVLTALDTVFERAEASAGLTVGGPYEPHQAVREGEAGLVEVWPTVAPGEAETAPPFAPQAETAGGRAPVELLAERIAATIQGWLDGKTELGSRGRPIRPGDILILVRRREPFTGAIIRALKARQIPVAGADRMRLTEQLAVMDLMALGDFLLMTEDDLALAAVLKSPLFGFDDDDLFALGWQRKGSLWRALRARDDDDPRYAAAAARLETWLARADYHPPYEFFSGVLEENGMEKRHRLIARLGAPAADALDEFLALALAYEREQPPSLQGFLHLLRGGRLEVKRDMEQGRDEVRVMTVHGAKGLEAEIVFLPDTCGGPGGPAGPTLLTLPRAGAPPGAPGHLVWVPPGMLALDAIEEAKEQARQAQADEHRRLLYVALTRARDRLTVCGWETSKRRARGCWYDLVSDGLKGLVQDAADAEGRPVWRYETPQRRAPKPPKDADVLVPAAEDLPPWAREPAPEERPAGLRAAPSALEPVGAQEAADDADQPVLSPDKLADQSRFLRGTLIHALLQHLPDLPPADRQTAAEAFVAVRGAELGEEACEQIVAETLAVLDAPAFAPLFAPGSLAEVPIAARLARDPAAGPPLDISGQIDRLAILDDAVLIVDYKTNRPPPEHEADVAPAYVRQLAAYRAAIREIFPDKTIGTALLWTDGPRLMPISQGRLDQAAAALGLRHTSP